MSSDQHAFPTDENSDKAGAAAWAARQSLVWHLSPDLLGTVNSSAYFETANPAWMTVLGWAEAEVTSVSLFELVHPDDVERAREQLTLAQQGQPTSKFVNRYRHKDGGYRWISWVSVPEQGMVFCTGRDITAEVDKAEQLAAARRERDTAWAVSQDLLTAVALDGSFTSVNAAWTRLLGWTDDELIGRAFAEFTYPDDLDDALKEFAHVSVAPLSTPYEFRLRHKDGSYRWFAWTAALAGELVYANGRDTTAERENAASVKAAEDALRDSLAFFAGSGEVARAMREADWSATTLGDPRQWPQSLRSVVNLLIGSAFPMFVCWGPDLATLYNDAYVEVLGDKHPAALGKPLLETWSEIRADIEPLVMRALAGESTFLQNLPLRMHRRGYDEDTWFTFSYSALRDEGGRTAGMYCACVETTEVVLAHQSLRNADRQKDEFLATLAHELRNPLAPIRTAVYLLASPKANEQSRLRSVEIIERQVSHMSRLLEDLLDVARITQNKVVLKKERVQVASVVEAAMEAARPLAVAKGHQLVVALGDSAELVNADPVRLAQVLTNLLNNAVKYTDSGGFIRLETCREGDELCFTVTDNGIGLTPQALEQVFTMFAQEKTAIERSEGGLGIGLALARGLVQLHGGSLSARSEGEGKGSRFMVKLPHDAGLEQSAPTVAVPTFPSRTRTVLLADDNKDSTDTLAELLRISGHIVHTAYDGRQAAELANQLHPDVLILDIGMPGLTGYEVAKHVRSQTWGASALLIAATGWGQDEDQQKALVAGFDHHLTKPFDPGRLVELIA